MTNKIKYFLRFLVYDRRPDPFLNQYCTRNTCQDGANSLILLSVVLTYCPVSQMKGCSMIPGPGIIPAITVYSERDEHVSGVQNAEQ